MIAMVDAELHVIFGAGQVGYPLVQRLLAAGKRVRVAKRTAGHVPLKAQVVLGDAAERAFCIQAAQGASTIYHCMNPPYDARIWAEKVPRYMDNLIAAAAETNARLVVLDNLYMLGRPEGRALNEDTPLNPCSRKGEIRARAAERLFEAHRQGRVVATSGRASDFYGPGGTLTPLGDFFWPRVFAGKTAYSPYPLDAVHTYHYIPDVAISLVTLGCGETDVYGRSWMLPCAPAVTLRELVRRLALKSGLVIKVAQVPRVMVKTVALFMPLVRELDEMLYQWDEPFVVDDSRFRERFGLVPTDIDEGTRRTAEWAATHYRQTTLSAE